MHKQEIIYFPNYNCMSWFLGTRFLPERSLVRAPVIRVLSLQISEIHGIHLKYKTIKKYSEKDDNFITLDVKALQENSVINNLVDQIPSDIYYSWNAMDHRFTVEISVPVACHAAI